MDSNGLIYILLNVMRILSWMADCKCDNSKDRLADTAKKHHPLNLDVRLNKPPAVALLIALEMTPTHKTL